MLGAFPSGYGDSRVLFSFRLERKLNEVSRHYLGRALTGLPNYGVRRYLRREGFLAVLAEFGPTGALLANDCQAVGIPLIAHFHGYDAFSRLVLGAYAKSYRRLFATAAAIVVVSNPMRQQLERLGAPPHKLFWNPCGVDVDRFCGGSPAEAEPLFLAVGRFVEKKAPHVVLEAFRRTLLGCPEARLRMIGDGPLFEESKALADRLRIRHRVDFPGVLTHAEVADAMRGARAFVHHAVTTRAGDSEGTPVSVLEAAASGLPVVSTRHGGIPDFVLHERTGYLVGEHEVGKMAEYMISLGRDPSLSAELGRAGREHVRQNGSLKQTNGRLWSIIEASISGDLERIRP